MNNDVLWLVRLGIDQGLFSREQSVAVRKALGGEAEIAEFAQKLIDDAIVDDIATLEKLAGLAMSKGQKGAPASDPFVASESDAPFAPAATAAAKKPSGPAVAGPPPEFAFDTIGMLDDAGLAAALRGLLRATARHLASDLHLSTGARPFIRKNRELVFISDYKLTAEDSLRLNTALLAEGQKKIFLQRKDYDYALALSATDRYRVNLMFHKNGAAGAYRMVPEKVRTLEDLGYSAHLETLRKLLSYHNGLILITGPVGSGKTTTLASMVAYLNETRTDHIITV
ncbi:MAG: pilT 1, partial [Verrucomicrobia bacterium]|nr:pilT 1 [Verrucomicrobiota bacterium]